MIHTAQTSEKRATYKADVVVIGSGAGGAIFAHKAMQKGARVILLEQGPYIKSSTFNQRELDMYDTLYDGGARTGPSDLSSSILYGRVLGGSSVHYMANSFRLPAFKEAQWRAAMGGTWHDPKDMLRAYEEVEALLSVHEATESELNQNNRLLKKGLEKLGWRGDPARHARKDCIGAGTCLIGCPFDKKMSQLITTIPAMEQGGVPIFTDCTVDELKLQRGRPPVVKGIRATIKDPKTGKRVGSLEVDADLVVLAAGGVGSPIFWKKNRLPDPNKLVGKNFQVTPHLFVFGEFSEPVHGTYGLPCSWVSHQFEEQKGTEGGYMIQGVFAQPGMVASMMPGFGAKHRELMALFSRGAAILSLIDDEEPGEVKLGPGGNAELHYHLRGKDIPKAKDFLKKACQILLAAGAKQVIVPDIKITTLKSEDDLHLIDDVPLSPGKIPFVGTSCLGTLRMNEDPKKGVVNLEGEAHLLKNLLVVDASWFPLSSAVDPSLTIMMNSTLIAEKHFS